MNKFETMCPELKNERCSFAEMKTLYDLLKFQFENGFDVKTSTIKHKYVDWFNIENQNTGYEFECCKCNESYNIEELTFKNNKLICKCGAEHTPDNIYSNISNRHMGYISQTTRHNLNNDTSTRVSVPSIISGRFFYCNECHTTQELNDMDIKDKKRVCQCGKSYSFEECRISDIDNTLKVSGNVFFDDNKITITYMSYHAGMTANDIYYWQDGTQRLTMNLETGYSYMSNYGYEYTIYNKIFRERHGKNAPKMFNATYSTMNRTLDEFCSAKYYSLLKKYSNHKNLINYLINNQRKVMNKIFDYWFNKIDNYMTNYFNTKYSYGIKSLTEKCKESRKERIKPYESYIITLYNRFINASFRELSVEIPTVLDYIKRNKKRNYKNLLRESNNVLLDYICKSINASKKLRKRINADIISRDCSYNIYSYVLDAFINITKYFKHKENTNKLYNLLAEYMINERRRRRRFFNGLHSINDEVSKFWLSYRDEHYISNLSIGQIDDKSSLMIDSLKLIKQIIEVYGTDWDLNSVKFYNEKQFHDELCRITNAEEFVEILNRKTNEEAIKPFKMEDNIYELEETDNEIYVAKNQAILTNIGQSLGICVGGYGGKVKAGACRIVYLKENGIYKACLELSKKKKDKEIVYTLIQAKLRHNNLVKSDIEMNQKILDWAKKNNIIIKTNDMNSDSNIIEVQEHNELAF